jgi:beta-galactosidase/beta-glucuronidase
MARHCFLFLCLLPLAAQEIPRPEHPNPQFQREPWLTLNGKWEFEFDDADAGLVEDWAAGAKKFSRSINVPYAFETKLSGIGDTSFHPVVWYRRSLTVPPAWKGKRVLLRFGAVDYRATVWVNGRFAVTHEGGNVPFMADITPFLRPAGNTVTVRAWDPPTDRAIPRGKQYWEPKSRGIFYTRTSGIWQSVWLEAAGAAHIEFLKTGATLDGKVSFETRIQGDPAGVTLAYTIRDGKQTVATGAGAARGKYATAGAVLSEPRLWSFDRPNLYDVTLELKRGAETLDTVQTYFGVREVAIENGRVAVNHRPVYLKFLLDQGYWPESLLTPPTDAAIQYDIRMSKEMGFNGVRKHQKTEDPRFHYWADKMGFLVSGEIANAYVFDDEYAQRFSREWQEAVERDINHPCILIWNAINESWGVPNLRDPRQQSHLRALYHLTKALDPTRLFIDNEGWEHTETTDLYAVHDYTAQYGGLKDRWGAIKPFAGTVLPPNGRVYAIPGIPYNGTPLYLSEFGGIAFIAPGAQVPQEAWGYSGVEKTAESAVERLRGQYKAIAESPFIGICYTQITDVEQEINGLMTYDRKLKFDAKVLREINALLK